MIKEFLKYLQTPATPLARKMGYLSQSIALEERYSRCQKEWQPHIEKCQKFITDNLSLTTKNETVLVLGSGHLYETPIKILCETFEQVLLVDLVHPKCARDLASENKKILLLEMDLSGVGHSLLNLKKGERLPAPLIPDLFFTSPDLIISANLLSQLPTLPIEFLKKRHARRFNDVELSFFAQAIIENHLKMLNQFKAPVLLYTDTQMEVCNQMGDVLRKTISHSELSKFNPTAEWAWNVSPMSGNKQKNSIVMKEKAYILKVS